MPALIDRVIGRTKEIASVPSPTGEEADRARLVSDWWTLDGLEPFYDTVGNVRACLRTGHGVGLIVCAHLDTVFGRDVNHEPKTRGNRLLGPSVGDNSVAVAALSFLDMLLPDELQIDLWIAATVGEEGLGNLRGVRHLIDSPPIPLCGLITLEGNYLGRVVHSAVGSRRWRITLKGPGGHAWENRDSPSAIHEMARFIAALESRVASHGPDASMNVGSIEGGGVINVRAPWAAAEMEVRSIHQTLLLELESSLREVCMEYSADFSLELLGKRSAGSLPSDHRLVLAAEGALRSMDYAVRTPSMSTEANAAHEAGLPAIALGITTGAGQHSRSEWIDIPPIGDGLTALANTITRYATDHTASRTP